MGKLTVYSASAGSGKTHSIVGKYINMLFSGDKAYKHILAVTFTNKAGEEMKTRIISELDKIASDKDSKYISQIQKTYKLSEEQIRNKAKYIFKQILHDYSHFSVSTIDSFYQKILKNFAYETGIQYNYEIELDTENVINNVVDSLIILSNEDKNLRKNIIELINQNIAESKKWDSRYSIKEFIKNIYNSEYRIYEDDFNKFFNDKAGYEKFLSDIYSIIHNFEKYIDGFKKDFKAVLNSNSIDINAFSGGTSKSIARRMLNISEELKKNDKYIPEIFNNYDVPNKWLRKSDINDSDKFKIVENLIEKCSELKIFIAKEYPIYYTSLQLRRQLFYISLMSYVYKEINKYKEDNNKFMISEVPDFLAQISENNSSSFIYEKAGTYYNNYLIDEFQDTSQIQWKAFRPLIMESLASDINNENILVGDVKQSIYGWRGGDWELLGEHIKEQFSHFYNETDLIENHRSYKNIVDFNNKFFDIAADLLQNDFNNKITIDKDLKIKTKIKESIYNKIKQNCTKTEEGYIEINLINKSKKNNPRYSDDVMPIMIRQIELIQQNNYNAGDIMILVRSNKEGKSIADYIINYAQSDEAKPSINYDVISADSLFIPNNDSVSFIISCLKILLNSDDKLAYSEAAYNYHKLIKADKTSEVYFEPEKYFEEFNQKFEDAKPILFSLPLPEVTDRIINIFGINKQAENIPFLTSLRDLIHDFSQNNNSDIYGFLEWWEEFGEKQTLKIPEKQNAITIITGHKAKGLSEKFVILPFCDWDFTKSSGIIWSKINEKPFNSLPVVPLKYTEKLGLSLAAEDYENERLKKTIESFNLLYVAFTRPVKGLFIIGSSKMSEKNKKGFMHVGQLLASTISSSGILSELEFNTESTEDNEITKYSKGKIIPASEEVVDNKYFESYPVFIPGKKPVIKSFFDIENEKPETINQVKKGIIYHNLFEKIKKADDLQYAAKNLLSKGLIRQEESKEIVSDISKLLNNRHIKTWFDGTYKVLTEAEIFCGNNQIKRPDRIMEKENEVIVLDYKFGEKETQTHINQLLEYGELLKEIGYKKVEMYLWYLFLNKVIAVCDKNKFNTINII